MIIHSNDIENIYYVMNKVFIHLRSGIKYKFEMCVIYCNNCYEFWIIYIMTCNEYVFWNVILWKTDQVSCVLHLLMWIGVLSLTSPCTNSWWNRSVLKRETTLLSCSDFPLICLIFCLRCIYELASDFLTHKPMGLLF